MYGEIPFGELPDEVQELVKKQIAAHAHETELHSMQVESARHRMLAFLESLDAEQMECLRGLIYQITGDESTAAYYMGLTAGMQAKFDYCVVCHEKHPDPRDEVVESELLAEEKKSESQLVEEFDLEWRPNLSGVGASKTLHCKNCGMEYTSLDDRMLRPPGVEGCSGCTQKEKWG